MGTGQKRTICLLTLAAGAVFLTGCATQPGPHGVNLPGFFSGLLHGFLILFSLIGSLFTDVRIYSFPNAGRWYDFGYFLGAAMFLGGAHASQKSGLNRCTHVDKGRQAE
jgi:hypothetical protein